MRPLKSPTVIDGMRPRKSSSQLTHRCREMDSNHRYPQKFFDCPVDPPRFTFRNINRLSRDRDRWFESISLQRRVSNEPRVPDAPRAPCRREHVFATKIERMLAVELGVDWRSYDREVSSKDYRLTAR